MVELSFLSDRARIRTWDRLLRRQMLYPAELRDHLVRKFSNIDLLQKQNNDFFAHKKKPHISCRAFQFIYFDESVMIAVISMMMVMVAFFVHFFLHDLFLIIG